MKVLPTTAPLMWANTSADLPEDTYCQHEAQRLTSTVQRTARVHGTLRGAVAAALTTALVALGEDWRKEAETHYPQVFTEAAAEPGPLVAVR